jgi:hypothetical protein
MHPDRNVERRLQPQGEYERGDSNDGHCEEGGPICGIGKGIVEPAYFAAWRQRKITIEEMALLALMENAQAPFVRNSNGEWEPIQLHHVGRETGQLIEVTRSQNAYNSSTGGPLHIPEPGGPVRQPNYSQSYWQQRYKAFVASGKISE